MKKIPFIFTVGYDDRKMMLGGQFDYEEDNQVG